MRSDERRVHIPGMTAVVTGGVSGIGKGTVKALLRRGAGVVIAHARRRTRVNPATGARFSAYCAPAAMRNWPTATTASFLSRSLPSMSSASARKLE